jgi:sec-independent protein translocase protein TatB
VFDVGMGEILLLILAALFVFGPDRLPGVVSQAARLMRQVRELAAGARSELSDAIGPELRDLDLAKDLGLRELNPRRAIERLVAQVDVDGPAHTANGSNGSTPARQAGDAPTGELPRPSYDPDAT